MAQQDRISKLEYELADIARQVVGLPVRLGEPRGGSPEGTGYGEAIRSVLELAILWRDSTGSDDSLLGQCPHWTIRYWAHATTPNFQEKCPIGDQTRIYGLDAYHRHIMRLSLDLVEPDSPEAAIARWWIATSKIPVSRFELDDLPAGAAAPPSELTYYAPGVGHFFSRTSWDADATLLYVIAGPLHGGHAHEEHGNFGVWRDGWRTVTQSRWSNSGTAGDTPFHNVVRFEKGGVPILQSAQGATTLLAYKDSPPNTDARPRFVGRLHDGARHREATARLQVGAADRVGQGNQSVHD